MGWFEKVAARAETRGGWSVIPFRMLRRAAAEEGLSAAEAEIRCLEMGYVPSRYVRTMGTIGLAGQIRLLRSSVAVVGCGGLGGLVAELLARAGVGRLVLVDSDVFDDGNLNRQFLSTEDTIGISKAKAAARRVAEVNGAVRAEERQCRFDAFTAESVLYEVDIAEDCMDNLPSRRALLAECAERGLPVVSGAVAGFWGQVTVFFPDDPDGEHFYAGPSDSGVEEEAGTPPFTPAAVAALQCAETIKLLTGTGRSLRGEMLWLDLGDGEFSRLRRS